MINFSEILKSIFGKDIKDMSDKELISTIQKMRSEYKEPPEPKLEDLYKTPYKDWDNPPFYIRLVEFVPKDNIHPCTYCQSIIGRYAYVSDAVFFLKHEAETTGNACLQLKPVSSYRWKLFPDTISATDKRIVDGMELNALNTEIYNKAHENDPPTSWFDFDPFILEESKFNNREYEKYSGFELYLCAMKTLEQFPESTWLIQVFDCAIVKGLSEYRIPMAERVKGELLLKQGNKQAALTVFESAYAKNPKVGVKRNIDKLKKELSK